MAERFFSVEEVDYLFSHGNQVGFGTSYSDGTTEEQTIVVDIGGVLYPLTADYILDEETYKFSSQTVKPVIQKTKVMVHTYWEDEDGIVVDSEIVRPFKPES